MSSSSFAPTHALRRPTARRRFMPLRSPTTGMLIYSITGARPDVNARDAQGATPLMLAAEAGKGQSVAALRLNKLADLEITDNAGLTALTRAGLKGQKMIVNILIRYGA